MRILSTRPSVFSRAVIQQTSSSLTKFHIISITFCTIYFLHLLLPHSPTTSGEDRTVSCFRNTLVTLWTLTSLLEYYIKHLLTLLCNKPQLHRIKDKLSVYRIFFYICCNLLAFCQVWSLNEYVMLCYVNGSRWDALDSATLYIRLCMLSLGRAVAPPQYPSK